MELRMRKIRRRIGHDKKGFLFTIDALLASIILIGGLLLISKFLLQTHPEESTEYVTVDTLSALAELKMGEINSIFVSTNLTPDNNTNITNVNFSVLEQIGTYWALDATHDGQSLAEILAAYVLNNLFPNNIGIDLTINGTVFFSKPIDNINNRRVAERMITGIKANISNITGSTSSAYLQRIQDKRTSSFAYFGGFVGQGNITSTMELGDVSITNMTLEIDVALGSTFNLRINGGQCNTSTGNPLFTAQTPDMVADTWDITNCKGLMTNGQNNITFFFTNISSAYIQGGYLKVMYTTNEFQENNITNSGITHISGIDGVVNLYDSFYVPGNLSSLAVYLHYKVNTSGNSNKFYMTIGNTTIFYDNTTIGEKNITYADSNLTLLDYAALSLSTIPIRIGFENLSFETIITNASGFGDVVLTTDVSSSMSDSSLDLAKNLDKNFSRDILSNTSLNRLGLASYSLTTHSTLNLTNNLTRINSEIDSYNQVAAATCISCSVVDSLYLLTAQLHNDSWKYWTGSQFSSPPASWNQSGFDDSSWPSGNTPFGYGGVAGIVTTLNKTAPLYANLWKYFGTPNDSSGPIADFSSGILNYTANTFGWKSNGSVGNDGWDWQNGSVYSGNALNVNASGLSNWNGNYKLRLYIGNSNNTRQISDGAYGIQINITPVMYQLLQNSGTATVYIRWNWTGCSQCSSSSDWAWVKARFTNTMNSSFYLGSSQDSGQDSTNEIYASQRPTGASQGLFSQNIASYITGPGMYYLDFGGKLSRDNTNKNGIFYFDDIQLNFSNNNIGKTYYRNTFQIQNVSNISNAVLYVSSNDGAIVYLNGNLVDNDNTSTHTSSYWNRFVNVNMSYFNQTGTTNLLAVQLNNNDSSSGFFNLELRANVGNRQNALVIMTDGGANHCVTSWNGSTSSSSCNECSGRGCCPNSTTGQLNVMCPNVPSITDPGGGAAGTEQALEQLYNISCYLHSKYNVGLYAVAFGAGVSPMGVKTLNMSASCDNSSHFYMSSNASGLSNIYQSIAGSILSGFLAVQSQVILFSGGTFAPSTLYPDSYISYNFNPIVQAATPDEIEVTFESPKFTNCNPQINIPPGLRVVDAKIVSYSGIHWTDYLSVNGNETYNLENYNSNYTRLGDPFIVQIPPNYLKSGLNDFELKTGDDPVTNTNCSSNNSFIYTALIPSSTARSPVVEYAEGCIWTIQFEDDTFSNKSIPKNYNGMNRCNYTANNHNLTSTIENDAYNLAVYNLLKITDLNNNSGKVFVNFDTSDLEIVITTVSSVPYLWGPTIVKARVWQ